MSSGIKTQGGAPTYSCTGMGNGSVRGSGAGLLGAREKSTGSERGQEEENAGKEEEEEGGEWGPALEERAGRSEDDESGSSLGQGRGGRVDVDYDARTIAAAMTFHRTRHQPSPTRTRHLEMERWLKTRPAAFLRQQLTEV